MLLGFSHIGFAVPSMNDAVTFFKDCGFRLEFMNEGLRNAPEKKEFLNSCPETHNIAFLEGNINSVGVELVHYPMCTGKNFLPAFDITLKGHADSAGAQPSPAGPVWVVPDSSKCGIDSIDIKSCNFEASKKFWRDAAGFKVIAESRNALEFQPANPIPNWQLTLRVMKSYNPPAGVFKLDTPGSNLISLIATNIEADKAKLVAGGALNPSSIFTLEVNKKNLKICLLRSPEGQVVELIEFQKQGGRDEKNR